MPHHFVLPALVPCARRARAQLESNISQCSAFAHEQKRHIGGDPRIVHISICHDSTSYRPGIDISFPACLPAAFGDASMRSVPPSRRKILLSFRGSGRSRLGGCTGMDLDTLALAVAARLQRRRIGRQR